MKTFIPQYVEALCQELQSVAKSSPKIINAGSLFFGGGTPSLLSVGQFKRILDTVSRFFKIDADIEITLEANPGTVNKKYLATLKKIGFNRISFGMQSANPDDLRILNRLHRHENVIQCVAWSKQAGFKHINLDLIFGIPGQTLQNWQHTLEMALMENVDHLSIYSLSVEEGTPLKRWIARGLLQEPENDLAAEMYETAMLALDAAGYEQYEISNWARRDGKDTCCRHNLQYWRGLPYLGFGAGAHGFIADTRTENASGIEDYINRVFQTKSFVFPEGPACALSTRLSGWERMQEFLMVGFRLTNEGISRSEFKRRFGYVLELLFDRQLVLLLENGLIERHPGDVDRLRLTKRGVMLGNRVFEQFVGNKEPEILEIKL